MRWGGARARGRTALLVVIAAAVIGLDQWTKSWAQQALEGGRRHLVGPVNLVLSYNRGAAFSFGSGATPVIVAVAVTIAVAVLVFSNRLTKGGAGFLTVVALGLLSGGAVSNLADRLLRHHHGGVVDFIQLVSWWPVFNVADASITVGAVALGIRLAFFAPGPLPRRAGGPGPGPVPPQLQGPEPSPASGPPAGKTQGGPPPRVATPGDHVDRV